MNRLVRVALVLAATLAVTMPAQAVEDVRGWRNTTWKMSVSEVKRSVGALGLVVTSAPASPSPPAEGPFRTKVDIDGSEYDVAFYFLDDPRQLGRVQVGGQDAPRDDALRRHASLLRVLTDQLGAPSETDSRGSLLSMTRWTFKTKVDIDGSEYDVAFHFLDEPRQLGRVQVGGQDVPREDALRRHASLLRMLTDRLGAPSETDSRGSLLSMTRWTFKTTTIALNMYTDTGARDRSSQVAVTYSPTAQRAEDRGKVLGFGLLQLLGGFWKR